MFTKLISLIVSTLLLASLATAQQTATHRQAKPADPKAEILWQKLSGDVSKIAQNMPGVAGVAIVDLTSGQQILINADQVFPTASSIKIAVLAELYRQSQDGGPGKAKLSDIYVVNQADLVPDSYVLGGLTPGVTRLTNRDVATAMVAVSDNSAANILIDRVGMANVNHMLDSLGLTHTRLQRKMMDTKAAEEGRENISTPRELALLLEDIYRGKLLNQEMTSDFFKMLSTPKDSWIPRLLPEDMRIANKPGSLSGVRNDVGLVFVKGRPFIVSVMTAYDRNEIAAQNAISQIARDAFDYFDIVGASSEYGRTMEPLNVR